MSQINFHVIFEFGQSIRFVFKTRVKKSFNFLGNRERWSKQNSITARVTEKRKFCINIFAILKLNVEARVTRFVSSYRSFDTSQLPPFPSLEETTRKWMELRYVARVKGIPDNTFFVNFFCVYMEKTLISFFSLSLFIFASSRFRLKGYIYFWKLIFIQRNSQVFILILIFCRGRKHLYFRRNLVGKKRFIFFFFIRTCRFTVQSLPFPSQSRDRSSTPFQEKGNG